MSISNRRRTIIIITSVLGGSLISFLIVKQRVGALSSANYNQLVFNFIFAVAIVVGIAILFKRIDKKDK